MISGTLTRTPGCVTDSNSQGRFVALKVLTADALYGEKHIDELNILQRTASANPRHPGHDRIVQLLGHFQCKGPNGTHLCLVLEVLGPSLRDIQDRYHTEQREMPSIIVKRVTKQVLIGLDYLHRSCRIVHTGTPTLRTLQTRVDLQPNNILLELQEADSVITAFLQSQVGGETSADAETIVLPNGEEYKVAECCSLPMQVSPLQDSNVQVKIADLGMGKRHPRSTSNMD